MEISQRPQNWVTGLLYCLLSLQAQLLFIFPRFKRNFTYTSQNIVQLAHVPLKANVKASRAWCITSRTPRLKIRRSLVGHRQQVISRMHTHNSEGQALQAQHEPRPVGVVQQLLEKVMRRSQQLKTCSAWAAMKTSAQVLALFQNMSDSISDV